MGFIPPVEAAFVIVICVGLYALLLPENSTQRIGHIAIPGSIEAGSLFYAGGIGPQAQAEGILAVCCVVGIGIVEIPEHKAFIHQLIQRRSQFRMDRTCGKTFST